MSSVSGSSSPTLDYRDSCYEDNIEEQGKSTQLVEQPLMPYDVKASPDDTVWISQNPLMEVIL